ncbi:MAG: hypothetical protein U1E42_04680 [Rhodospirillales bacterium]
MTAIYRPTTGLVFLVFLAALAIATATIPIAVGTAAEQASLQAVGRISLPPGTAIAVAAGDDNERTHLLLPAIEDALRARGLAASPEPPSAWRLLVTTTTGEPDAGSVRLSGSIGSNSRPDVTVELPLPQWPGPRQPAAYLYGVAMTLDRPGGAVVWQGSASAALANADALVIHTRLASALVGHLGETVAKAPIPLD